jgi:hypothetical protein
LSLSLEGEQLSGFNDMLVSGFFVIMVKRFVAQHLTSRLCFLPQVKDPHLSYALAF